MSADRRPAKARTYDGPPTMGASMQAVRVRFVPSAAADYDRRARKVLAARR